MIRERFYSLDAETNIVPFVLNLDRVVSKEYWLFHSDSHFEKDNRFTVLSPFHGLETFPTLAQFQQRAPSVDLIKEVGFQVAYRKLTIANRHYALGVDAKRRSVPDQGLKAWDTTITLGITGWNHNKKENILNGMFDFIEQQIHASRAPINRPQNETSFAFPA